MFTDWTTTDPRYFWARGALWGVIATLFVIFVAIPWVRKKLGDRRHRFEAKHRWEGRRARAKMGREGAFEGEPFGAWLNACNKHNPYKPASLKANLWETGFLE